MPPLEELEPAAAVAAAPVEATLETAHPSRARRPARTAPVEEPEPVRGPGLSTASAFDDSPEDAPRGRRRRPIRTWGDLARARGPADEGPEDVEEAAAEEPVAAPEPPRRRRAVRTWADYDRHRGGGVAEEPEPSPAPEPSPEASEEPAPRRRRRSWDEEDAEDAAPAPRRRRRSWDDPVADADEPEADADEEPAPAARRRRRSWDDPVEDSDDPDATEAKDPAPAPAPAPRRRRRSWDDPVEAADEAAGADADADADEPADADADPAPRRRRRSWDDPAVAAAGAAASALRSRSRGDADEAEEAPRPRRRRSWADDEPAEEEQALPRRRRSWADEDPGPPARGSSARRGGRDDSAEDAPAGGASRSKGAGAGQLDDALTQAIYADLHDMLFSGLKGALELRAEADDFITMLEAIDAGAVCDEIRSNGDRTPRMVEKLLRRQGHDDVDLGATSLGEEVARALRSTEQPWDEVADAFRTMRRGAIIPQDDGDAYLDAARAALPSAKVGRKGPVLRAAGLQAMVGSELGSPFRPGKSSTRNPKRLLGNYHAALRAALGATDEAWVRVFDAVVSAVEGTGGPALRSGQDLSGQQEEVRRLQEKALELIKDGEVRKAMKVVDKAVNAALGDAQVLVFALQAANDARAKEEIGRYSEMLEQKFPDEPDGIAARTFAMARRGDERGAVALLERGLEIAPTHRPIREQLTALHIKQRNYDRALRTARTLAEDFPTVAAYHMWEARAHGFLDHEQPCLDALQRYVDLVDMDSEKVNQVKNDEAFDCLAAEPAFERLLEVELDLLAVADSIFNDTPPFYFSDDIPASKLKNARRKWLKMKNDETLVFIIDTTFMGRCTEGVAVTDERVIWKDMGCDPESLRLDRLKPTKIKNEQGTVHMGRRTLSLVGQQHLAGPMAQFLTAVARTNQ